MTVKRGMGRLVDLSLRGKVAVAVAAVFASIAVVFLLLLVGFQRDQRQRLLDQERRLLATLRDKYERDFIYDLLSENRESLTIDLADLARQSGIVWARLDADGAGLSATADPGLIARVLGEALPVRLAPGNEPPVLVVEEDGSARIVGAGGRPLVTGRRAALDQMPSWERPDSGQAFEETTFDQIPVLHFSDTLSAAGESFGHFHVLYSLETVTRGERLTRGLFFGLAGTSFVLLLLLLNLLLARIVLAPLGRVVDAMSQASRGQLDVRLAVHSRDEIGTMAASFNGMVEQLQASKAEIEGYSRDLEAKVEERTRELRESERDLLAVKNHLATVIDNVATGVISLDEHGCVSTFNGRAAEILSVSAPAAVSRRLEDVLVQDEAPRLVEWVSGVVEGTERLRTGQLSLRLAQGRRTLSVVASSLLGGGGRPVGAVVVLDDLTQLLATQRLEAWKEAVERVIHEIKNPLTPVGLAAQTLRAAHAGDRERFEAVFPSAIEMILGAVRDLKALIFEFAEFSRLPAVELARIEVNALVSEALAPYEHGGLEGIRVVRELSPRPLEVEADAPQLKRVLLNVVNNGLEAMEDRGGELRVGTEGPDALGRVSIWVRDQGPGVEDVERIFEPRYTTKVKGTGLGLAIARRIVEEHGGEMRVESTLGRGTVVRVLLPASQG